MHAEAQSLARLNHPHIVRIFDYDADPVQPYLVLECVDGLALRDLIQQSGRLQPGQVRKLLAQVTERWPPCGS